MLDEVDIYAVLEISSEFNRSETNNNIYRDIWIKVLVQAFRDAENNINTSEMKYAKNHAIAWLTSSSKDFNMVCNFAGINPVYALKKFRQYFKNKEKLEETYMDNQIIESNSFSTLSLEEKTVIAIPPGELKAKFKKMLPFMSEDEVRYYLCGIYCKYFNGKLTLCATNGHILCEIIQDLEACEDGSFSLIIPATSVKHLINVMPNNQSCPVILMKVSRDNRVIEFESDDFSYSTKAIDGDFPNYQELIPDGTNKMREGMQAGYLMSALKALGNTPVDISVDDDEDPSTSPHLLTSREAEGIKCVIMPMRV